MIISPNVKDPHKERDWIKVPGTIFSLTRRCPQLYKMHHLIWCTTKREKMLPIKVWHAIDCKTHPNFKGITLWDNVHPRTDEIWSLLNCFWPPLSLIWGGSISLTSSQNQNSPTVRAPSFSAFMWWLMLAMWSPLNSFSSKSHYFSIFCIELCLTPISTGLHLINALFLGGCRMTQSWPPSGFCAPGRGAHRTQTSLLLLPTPVHSQPFWEVWEHTGWVPECDPSHLGGGWGCRRITFKSCSDYSWTHSCLPPHYLVTLSDSFTNFKPWKFRVHIPFFLGVTYLPPHEYQWGEQTEISDWMFLFPLIDYLGLISHCFELFFPALPFISVDDWRLKPLTFHCDRKREKYVPS